MLKVAVVGAGYWGPNLIRNFVSSPKTDLVAICDQSEERLKVVGAPYPTVEQWTDYQRVLDRKDIEAVAIATPVHTHSPLATAALEAGKHVLVEKPLTGSVDEAEKLVELADNQGRVLMTDHTFVYSGAVRLIKSLIENDELGDIYYIDSSRINLGLFQQDVNVVWDLAVHDLSILDYLLGELPLSLSAWGACHTDPFSRIEDVAYLNLKYGSQVLASVHVSWLSPVKVRQFIIGGSKKSVVYDDLQPMEKVKVYDRGMACSEDPHSRHRVLVSYRTGDVWSPHIEQGEPLRALVEHFAECIENQTTPLTDGQSGLRIVKALAAAQTSLKSGSSVALREGGASRRAAA